MARNRVIHFVRDGGGLHAVTNFQEFKGTVKPENVTCSICIALMEDIA